MTTDALRVEMAFKIDPPVLNLEEFHGLGERLMEALMDLETCNDDVFDPAVSTEADTGLLRVEIELRHFTDAYAAVGKVLGVIRTAAHTVGFGTHGWPTPDELVPVAVSAEPVDALVPA